MKAASFGSGLIFFLPGFSFPNIHNSQDFSRVRDLTSALYKLLTTKLHALKELHIYIYIYIYMYVYHIYCLYCLLDTKSSIKVKFFYCLKKESKLPVISFQKTSVEKKPPVRSLQTLHVYSSSKQRGKDVT